MSLHDELSRLADTAPRPSIDHTVWDRGRALRRRDRLVTSAAVLALVVIVGGLASLVLGPPRDFAPADDPVPDGAIPSRIVDVPQSVRGAGQDDLAIGRASVAFISSGAHTVLISASDGAYHRVELPDRQGPRTMRLSPDGSKLAYVFATPSDQQPETMVSGVAVVDLATGDIAQVAAINSGGTTVDIGSFGWSANSRWLAWSGYDIVSWSEMSVVTDTTGTMGAIDTETMSQYTTTATPGAVGVSDDGTVTLVNRDAQVRFVASTAQRVREPFPLDEDVFAGGDVSERAITSSDGALTAVGLTVGSDAVPFVTLDGAVLQRTLADDLYPRGARVTPLGWAAPSLMLGMVEPRQGSDALSFDRPSLALFTSPDKPEDEWTYRLVVRDLPDLAEVSVAVDLIPDLDGTSSQQLTHDFPEPDWPMSEGMFSLLIGLGVAGALSVLYGLRWLWRRRTGLV